MAKIQKELLELADGLHSAAIHLLRQVRVEDRSSGIGPAQLSALSVLVFGGSMSLKRLAEVEQVKPPTMVRIVRGLVDQRLATQSCRQERRPQDRHLGDGSREIADDAGPRAASGRAGKSIERRGR